jgi:hypothetical protein
VHGIVDELEIAGVRHNLAIPHDPFRTERVLRIRLDIVCYAHLDRPSWTLAAADPVVALATSLYFRPDTRQTFLVDRSI